MKQMPVMKKLVLSYSLLILGLMALMGIYILPSQLKELEENLEDKISWTARLIAEDTDVVRGTAAGRLSSSLKARIDRLVDSSADIDYLVIANANSIRLYHPDQDLVGQPFSGGDENAILNGDPPYITLSRGTVQIQKRAFHAIRNENGQITGFVMASASLAAIRSRQIRILLIFLLIFLSILALGILVAFRIARGIRKDLLGFEPDTFAGMFLQREEILDTLSEGILALGAENEILYQNASARTITGLSVPKSVLPSASPFVSIARKTLQSQTPMNGQMVQADSRMLVVSSVPLSLKSPVKGSLLILRDRTEITHLSEQITGMNHIVDALRANTHEYLNKLHVISGLLQIGEISEAVHYISNIAAETENGYQAVIRQIENRTVAALFLGKNSHARELDIRLTLRKDSFLPAHNTFLSTRELVTILGNLIENAFEAINGKTGLRQVDVLIRWTENSLVLSADDTGCGMTPEQIRLIRKTQYTTKGEGHGIGLRLIQEIVEKHSGCMDIESEPGEGTSFTICFFRDLTKDAASPLPAEITGKGDTV